MKALLEDTITAISQMPYGLIPAFINLYILISNPFLDKILNIGGRNNYGSISKGKRINKRSGLPI